MDIARLKLAVDSSGVKHATKRINRMADAVSRLNGELEKLGDKRHGGVTVEIVGNIAVATVAPPRDDGIPPERT